MIEYLLPKRRDPESHGYGHAHRQYIHNPEYSTGQTKVAYKHQKSALDAGHTVIGADQYNGLVSVLGGALSQLLVLTFFIIPKRNTFTDECLFQFWSNEAPHTHMSPHPARRDMGLCAIANTNNTTLDSAIDIQALS